MINTKEIGPRIFYSTDAAYECRSREGGRVFLPRPANGEVMWFPPTMTPSTILTHRMVRGLDGVLVDRTGPREVIAA